MRAAGDCGDSRPSKMRELLLTGILEFLAVEDLLTLEDIRAALEREIDGAGPDALLALKQRLTTDIGWGYYPRDPLAQRIHHLLADRFLHSDSHVSGVEHLAELGTAPVVICANHLSYADANVVEVLLQRSGGAALANRLTAVAGPKVFASQQRRFSSLCFGTVKVPQSTDVSSEEVALNPRELARAARQAIDAARARLDDGDALLLFGEGTRSRTAEMRPMLAGAARYLESPGVWVVLAGLAGPEALFPIDAATVQPARVMMRLGVPIRANSLFACAGGSRRLVMDAIGVGIGELLPPPYRGAYEHSADLQDARSVLRNSRHRA
jgi:1-acyl-sn-glycerol-3-phosphate acyltransferase